MNPLPPDEPHQPSIATGGTPNETHLRAAKELNAAFNLYAWDDSEKECASILARHFPAPPALTGGDEEQLQELYELGEAYAKRGERDGQIAALEAQVAELDAEASREQDHHEFYRGKVCAYMGAEIEWQKKVDTLKARITELERDKARMSAALDAMLEEFGCDTMFDNGESRNNAHILAEALAAMSKDASRE